MPFREGDTVVVQIDGVYIRLDLKARIELMDIVLDEREEEAVAYLADHILPVVERATKHGGPPLHPHIEELQAIVQEGAAARALSYLTKVVYPEVVAFVKRPGCKPMFELPFGNPADSYSTGA